MNQFYIPSCCSRHTNRAHQSIKHADTTSALSLLSSQYEKEQLILFEKKCTTSLLLFVKPPFYLR